MRNQGQKLNGPNVKLTKYQRMNQEWGKWRVLNTLTFIICCISVGQLAAILLSCLVFDINPAQLTEILKDPVKAEKSLIIFISFLYPLFSFFIIPVSYLLFRNKAAVRLLWGTPKIRLTPFLFSILIIFTIVPLVGYLISLNQGVEFPAWMSEAEDYFRESEEKAKTLTGSLLSSGQTKELIIAVILMAIIPGIVEEFFFRGIVQVQLQDVFKNPHYAIWLAAFLFSFFHFQFFGFLPRLVLGALLGYLFIWSKNILVPCAAHITNNLIAVMGAVYLGPDFFNNQETGLKSVFFIIPSVILTGLLILFLRRKNAAKNLLVSGPGKT